MNKMEETKQNGMDLKHINPSLTNIKDNSWVGVSLEDTKTHDFIVNELKKLLSNEELKDATRLKVLKQLQDLDNEKAKRAMHLDQMMLKALELNLFNKQNNLDQDLF